jgi:excisionase family DNA binding protein
MNSGNETDGSPIREPSHLLTAREAAALLRISERTLWTLTKQGKIKATRIQRRVLYSLACLQLFVDASTFGDDPE